MSAFPRSRGGKCWSLDRSGTRSIVYGDLELDKLGAGRGSRRVPQPASSLSNPSGTNYERLCPTSVGGVRKAITRTDHHRAFFLVEEWVAA